MIKEILVFCDEMLPSVSLGHSSFPFIYLIYSSWVIIKDATQEQTVGEMHAAKYEGDMCGASTPSPGSPPPHVHQHRNFLNSILQGFYGNAITYP